MKLDDEFVRQAVAEWREDHPDDDDLPDEVIAGLFTVQSRALGLAQLALGRAIRRRDADHPHNDASSWSTPLPQWSLTRKITAV